MNQWMNDTMWYDIAECCKLDIHQRLVYVSLFVDRHKAAAAVSINIRTWFEIPSLEKRQADEFPDNKYQ